MTVKGGTTPACAACAYQRRKCSPTCPLAPYFPANRPKMFRSVHRLFGVSNVTKILEKLNPNQKDEAMLSIIYEAEMRERFPVEGCLGVIAYLSNQLNLTQEELHHVCTTLQAYREEMAVGNDKVVGPYTDCWLAMDATGAAAQYDQFSLNGNGEDTMGGPEAQFTGKQYYIESKIEAKEAFESSTAEPETAEQGWRRELRSPASGFRLQPHYCELECAEKSVCDSG